jgi:hypothetical protein
MSIESAEKAENFLSVSSQYKLGKLVTESSHPGTRDLSYLALHNLPEAVAKLKELDDSTIKVLSEKLPEICYLKATISDTLKSRK